MALIRRKGIAIVEFPQGILVVAGRNKLYMLPGGGANHSESREKATVRELYEETGLKTKEINYLFRYVGRTWYARGKTVKNHAKVFLIKTSGKPRPRNEIKYIHFWSKDSKIRLSRGHIQVIDGYLKIKTLSKK